MTELVQRNLFDLPEAEDRHLLSATSLVLFSECPRCFYLDKIRGLKRPQGPFPSLPGGMDMVIKAYFDHYRKQNRLPPEVEGKLPGRLFPDQGLLNRWRRFAGPRGQMASGPWRMASERGGLWYRDKNHDADLVGLLDDCLVDGEIHIPLDYKTRGYPPKEDTSVYYQTQLDLYTLLLDQNGYKTTNMAYLIYYWPHGIDREASLSSGISHPTSLSRVLFETDVQGVPIDPNRGLKIFESAVQVLDQDNPPPRSADCPFCQWCEQNRQ